MLISRMVFNLILLTKSSLQVFDSKNIKYPLEILASED